MLAYEQCKMGKHAQSMGWLAGLC